MKYIKQFLQSYFLAPVIYVIALICWLFGQNLLNLYIYCAIIFAIFLLCNDVKNIFPIIFYIGFFVKDIIVEFNWIEYSVCVGLVFIGFLTFIIKEFILKKVNILKFPNLIPLIIMSVAFLLGGIIHHFNIINFAITFVLSLATVILYLFAYNNTKNLHKFLLYVFFVGGIFVLTEFCIFNHKMEGSVFKLHQYRWMGAVGTNTIAIYLFLGAIGGLFLGYKCKFDYLFILPTLIFFGTIILSGCRTVIIISIPSILFLFVLSLLKSKNKLIYIIVLACIFTVFLVYLFVSDFVIFYAISQKSLKGLSGRTTLWKWCFDLFKEDIWFGVGFITDKTSPFVRIEIQHFILAHNTVIQWLTSLGIIGTLMTIPFYYRKYFLLIKHFKDNPFIIIAVLGIALSGFMDQSATMEYYLYIIPIITLAGFKSKSVEQ